MGIPAAFRWLSNKYPKIISPVIEDQPMKMEDGTVIPVDATRPNPNGEEFDNLYLDMNGIVHPCTHPDDRPAPSNEEEMMLEVFRYTDRVVNMVRPRKLLMIAVDGVAPRAKMNQQRARRFRAAQEAQEKEADKMELLKLLKQQNGGVLPPQTEEGAVKKAFDSNSITPGTPFMDILSTSLRYWCAYKLNNDPAWAKLKIIISDASVPGEGEHKIMEFVRSQRSSPDHDPNTRHVIYGLDADLIMLGLATHEPHFRVLREDVFFQEGKARMCKLCGQKGHDAQNCRGDAKEKDGEHDEKDKAHPLKPFIWLHVNVLREYLAEELHVPGLPFRFDLERAIDDWVFLCFFVGNDFLPHLPALEIREHGIDTLTTIWRDNLPYMGGYMTKDGHVDLDRAQLILAGLAKQEDSIFKRRKEQDDRREAGFKRRKLQQEAANARNAARSGQSQFQDGLPSSMPTHDMIVNRAPSNDNKSAASALRQQIQDMMNKSAATAESSSGPELQPSPGSALGKRKASIMEADNASNPGTPTSADEGPTDTVRLWEDGYADRYYEQKFKVDRNDVEFRHKVGRAYVEGLAWVLMYYFQGCPSWEWYYPYHYAPFAQDFVDLGKMEIKFEKGRISRPFEQLMSVLPAASRHAIPEIFHDLMLNEDSEIIDFYPEDFDIDLNGKKMIWQGVILLPFIDMPRLLSAVHKKYPLLSEAEATRNSVGHDILIFSDKHPTLYDEVAQRFFSKKQTGSVLELDPKLSDGLSGKVIKIEDYIPHMTLRYPFDSHAMEDVEDDRSITVNYEFPTSSHIHKSMILRGARLPPPVLDEADKLQLKEKSSRNGRSYGGVPLQGRYNRDGGRRNMINYGPDRGRDEYQDRSRDRGGYDGGRNHNYNSSRGYQGPPQGNSFLPPPPGMPGFGAGLPPPPPPAYYNNSYSNNSSYGSNNGHGNYGYGNHRGGYDSSGGWNNRYGPTRDPYGGPPPDHYGGAPPPAAGSYHSGRDYRSDNRRGGGGSGGYRGGRDNRNYR